MKKLGFGLMRLPLLNPEDESSIDIETVKKMADAFLAAGFTYFDTAACYHDGHSETAFREAVARRYPREAYTITDKLTMFMVDSEEDFPGFFAGQLERLGVPVSAVSQGLGDCPAIRRLFVAHALEAAENEFFTQREK